MSRAIIAADSREVPHSGAGYNYTIRLRFDAILLTGLPPTLRDAG